MKISKTKFGSYYLNGVAEGCKNCVKGEKLVLFISGVCKRNCFYCSLSFKRKNVNKIWANERDCKSVEEVMQEARESNAKGAGITGGDPLLFLDRTIKYASGLKKKFGKRFHIHIYLPTKFVTKEKLRKLRCCIDEVRFHPEFLCKKLSEGELQRDVEKISQASLIFDKNNVGIELPILPDRKKEILSFIKRIAKDIGFVNLNELEISDTNFDYFVKKYRLKQGGYVVSGSKDAGLWILNKLKQEKLRIHLCTAETKNWYQYKNRLLKHDILPFGERTWEGTVIYFAIYAEDIKEFRKIIKKLKKFKYIYIDKKKKRIILGKKILKNLKGKYNIKKVEEYPTYDKLDVEVEEMR
jgi:hypothetical protein